MDSPTGLVGRPSPSDLGMGPSPSGVRAIAPQIAVKSPKIILRDYQDAAVESVWHYFEQGNTGNPIVAMPTGTGKSLINAAILQRIFNAYPASHALCLTHVKELIENNHAALLKLWPTAPAGIYSSGLKRRDLHAPITFGGIQSIYKRAALFRKTNLILIDECHLVSERAAGRYLTFINSLKAYNPYLKVIGLSATPFRMGLGHLTDGQLFDEVCFDLTSGEAFIWMIKQGYIVPVIPKKTDVEIDTDDVQLSMGEFNLKDLSETMDSQGVIQRALEETLRLAADRHCWLIFAPSISHCEEIAEYLTSRGIRTTSIHSKISNQERDERFNAFKAGHYRAAVNQNILTTGVDLPALDCIVMLRPTRSPGLWVQMLGRGTRPLFSPGSDIHTVDGRLRAIATSQKQDCLVLDYARNTRRLGPINYPVMPKPRRKGGGGEAPAKECPECLSYVYASLRVCPYCNYEFPRPEKLSPEASTEDLVVDKKQPPEIPIDIFPVGNMVASRHTKKGRPDSVRVDYYCGYRKFSEWVGVEHPSTWMKRQARMWWVRHAKDRRAPLPKTVQEMLETFNEAVRRPSHIKVKMSHPYPRIVDYDFTGDGFPPQEAPTSFNHHQRS